MGTDQNSSGGGGWFIDYGLVEDDHGADFLWVPQIGEDPPLSSSILGFDLSQKENCSNDVRSKKRPRVESCAAPGTKACREKMRRDRLNDRFTELCSVLEPGKPPKADKVAVLSDATRLLNQLRLEAKKLQESNEALGQSLKTLKEEKADLRDEKVKLKALKEQMVKGISLAPAFLGQQPTVTALTAVSLAAHDKAAPNPTYLPVGMSQWIPQAALDTSQDQLLRPPVA